MADMIQRDVIPPSNTLGWTVVVLDVLLLSLSACALVVRVNSRHIQRHSLCLNDYLAILAWVRACRSINHASLADRPVALLGWTGLHSCPWFDP